MSRVSMIEASAGLVHIVDDDGPPRADVASCLLLDMHLQGVSGFDFLAKPFRDQDLLDAVNLALAASGLMNKQIAGELGTSEITVKIHRGNAMRKMQARTFADLVPMAEALGIDTARCK